MNLIKTALLSVSDKTNLLEFAKELVKMNVTIYSTGGTYQALKQADIAVQSVSDLTHFPEIMDGRVKTLHPNIHGGLLGVRNNKEHALIAKEHGIIWIDLIAVNLYPFVKTIQNPKTTFEEAIENIDIGGPSMLRSAAKNHQFVTAICNPNDYKRVIDEMKMNQHTTTITLRKDLATKVFAHTSYYDSCINAYLKQDVSLPDEFSIHAKANYQLRYGENPHQKATMYDVTFNNQVYAFENFFEKLHGKELSYNNILDLKAATELIEEFENEDPTVVIIKHTNPCGVAQDKSLLQAYQRAFTTDTQAPFGGIIAVNQSLDMECAKAINEIFTEIIIAPNYEEGVIEFLQKKKDRRLLRKKQLLTKDTIEYRFMGMGLLAQDRDTIKINPSTLQTATKRKPTDKEIDDLLFAWKICKHVKSNAIVYVKDKSTIGIGAGQMSRVDSAKLAKWKSIEANLDLKGTVLASDAFFPFADGLLTAAEVGITAVIQPGGSIRDNEVIDAANEKNIAMVFTGVRHFRH